MMKNARTRNQFLGAAALALVMSTTVPSPAFASDETSAVGMSPATHTLSNATDLATPPSLQGVTNAAQLVAAIERGETQITLANDICLEHNLEINRDELVLNLNGHKLISLRPNLRVLDVKRGNVTLMGAGEIIAYGEGSVAIRVYGALTQDMPAYAKVTIGSEIALYAPTSYGIIISPNAINTAYGAEIVLKGQIIAHDGIYLNNFIKGGERAPIITIADNAKITADHETGTIIDAAGAGVWRIGKAVLTGATGIKVQTGDFRFENTKLTATGAPVSSANPTQIGAVFYFAPQYDGHEPASLALAGGRYASTQGYIFDGEPTQPESVSLRQLKIDRSMFSKIVVTGALDVFSPAFTNSDLSKSISIHSGQYNASVSEFLAPELDLSVDENGIYHVVRQSEEQLLAASRTQLAEALEQAAGLEQSDYTDESYQTLVATAVTAQTLLIDEQSSREQILQSIDALKAAQADLQLIAVVDSDTPADSESLSELDVIKQTLRSTLDRLSSLNASAYTPETYHVLASVMETAETLLQTPEVTQIALETSLHLLEVTENGLIAAPPIAAAEKARLDAEAIAEAKLCLNDALAAVRDLQPADFESDFDFGAMELLMERAEIILEDSETTMAELRDVTQDLLQAMKYLQGVDPESLEISDEPVLDQPTAIASLDEEQAAQPDVDVVITQPEPMAPLRPSDNSNRTANTLTSNQASPSRSQSTASPQHLRAKFKVPFFANFVARRHPHTAKS